MTTQADIENRITLLLQDIEAAPRSERAGHTAGLDQAIAALADQGHSLSAAVRVRLDALTDEAVEDQFDNLPL